MMEHETFVETARNAWLEAKRKFDEADGLARKANEETFLRFADYAELAQPGCAAFYRRLARASREIRNNEDINDETTPPYGGYIMTPGERLFAEGAAAAERYNEDINDETTPA